MKKSSEKDKSQDSVHSENVSRPPIIVVMGHVDHGKTTLLDYIRNTRVVDREAGGITQSVGAYEIEKNGRKITFIDTPGHEAFGTMRKRGAHIADLAILVVAADDGVKPQTKEVIEILQSTQTPFIVAINKIDKNNADAERTRQSLTANGVYLERYGGDVPWVAISAKNGTGIDELLDTVLLMADVEELCCNPKNPARGFVLESRRDSKKGIVVTVIIKDGTLTVGSDVAMTSACGKIRTLENFLGARVDSLSPSSPAVILGLGELPMAGEMFCAGTLQMTDPNPAPMKPEEVEKDLVCPSEADEGTIFVMLKADVSGTLEVLNQIISSLAFDNMTLRIVSCQLGDITDGDVKLAATTKAMIIGFNIKTVKSAEQFARAQGITIITSNIIYRLVEALQEFSLQKGKAKDLGVLEVLAVFSQKNKKQLVGGKVTQGFLIPDEKVTIVRNEVEIGNGRITNLQQGKMDKKRINSGECGVMVESPVDVQAGDFLVIKE